MAITKDDVIKLYVAMFNRAPEGEGVTSWYNEAVKQGWGLAELAQSMLAAAVQVVKGNPDYESIYPQYANLDLNNLTADNVRPVIETVYKILFNKDYNTDPEGIDTWVNNVVENGQPLGEAIASIILAAEQIYNDPNADPEAKKAAEAFMNKVEVAKYASEKIIKFDGDFTKFQGFIASVTDDPATVDAAKQAVDNVAVKLSEINLTPDADYLPGTTGDDTFVSLPVVNAFGQQVNTLNSTDVLDGLDGNDILRAQLVTNVDNAGNNVPISPRISNIETFSIRAVGNVILDFSDVSGAQTVINDSSVANLTFANLENFVELQIKDVKGQSTILNYDASITTGLTDKQVVKLTNVTENHNITIDPNIEILDIYSENLPSVVQFSNNASVNEIYISGDADLGALGNLVGFNAFTNLKKIDASQFTGDLYLDVSNANPSDMTVTGGSGNDTIRVANVDQNDSFDLGEGDNDTLIIVNPADILLSTPFKGIETIEFQGISQDRTISLAGADAVKTIKVTNDTGAVNNEGVRLDDITNVVSATNVGGTLENVVLNANGVLIAIDDTTDPNNDSLVDSDRNDDGLVNIDGVLINSSDAAINTDDVINLTIENIDPNGNVIIPNTGVTLATQIDIQNYETLNITTGQLGAADSVVLTDFLNAWRGANTLDTDTATAGIQYNIETENLGGIVIDVTDNSLRTLKIDSPTYVQITGLDTVASLDTIDASASTGGVIISAPAWRDSLVNSGNLDFKGSSGSDIVNLGANVATTTIDLNSGNDIFVLGDANGTAGETNDLIRGNLTINAGDGNDIVDISSDNVVDDNGDSDNTNDSNNVLITLGAGQDRIVMADSHGENVRITDFTAGGDGDVFDLLAVNASRGGATATGYEEVQVDIANGTNAPTIPVGDTTGLLVITNQPFRLVDQDADGLTIDEILDADADGDVDVSINVGNGEDILYVILSDGANSYLFLMEEGDNGDGDDDDGDIEIGDSADDSATLIATFVGVSNPALFTDDNFADFGV